MGGIGPGRRAFDEVLVLTGDPRLPDATKRGQRYNEEDFVTHRAMHEALTGLAGYRFEFFDDHPRLLERLRDAPPQFVLNFCDTGFSNIATQEWHVPALLELMGVPYSGAPPACMAVCYDKAIVRLVAEAHGIPVPREAFIHADQSLERLPDIYPALIKPNQADGSLGITKDAVVHDAAEANAYLRGLRRLLPGRAALMQEYLPGAEVGLGLIGNPGSGGQPGGGLRVLPPLQVDFSGLPAGLNPILSYESKALPDSPYWTDIRIRPAELAEPERRVIEDSARLLFARLGLRDYGRFDFRTGADGVVKLMEVNPNPAWANDGKLAIMAGFAAIQYPQMLEMILEAAQRRLGGVSAAPTGE